MCGIFGFITTQGQGPDVAIFRKLAAVTQTRGDHAFGLAWLEGDGAIRTFKRPGPATSHLEALEACGGATVLIGHCRFATHGSPADNRNNHPHAAGGGYLVHNGIVLNHRQLAAAHRLTTRTQCDSEVLSLLTARAAGTIGQRAAWMAERAEGAMAILGLWRRPCRLLIVRRGRPLHWGRGPEGIYFASLPEGLPGDVAAIRDGAAQVLRFDGGRLAREETITLEPPAWRQEGVA